MRILHIITRLIQGGAQQNTVLSCAAQVKVGHEVHLAYGPIYGPEGSLLEEAEASGATLHEIASMRRAINPWHDIRCCYALRKLIRDVEPDIVHTHSSKAGIIGRAAAWAENTPVVLHTVHGLPFHDYQPKWVYKLYVGLEKWASKRCHHLVAITPAMVDAFCEEGIADKDRFTVIHSGIVIEDFQPMLDYIPILLDELDIPRHSTIIGIVARLDKLKGHHDLIEIYRQLIEYIPNCKLLFVGDGNDFNDDSRGQIEVHAGGITMTGLVPHDKISRYYSLMDVCVLPSYQEGQSRVLAEALLCGCGIVAYNVGGIPSICIDGETGKLVPVGDKQALADAIVWMIRHPDQRRLMTAKGQKLVREKFSADHMTRELESLYLRLLKDKQ